MMIKNIRVGIDIIETKRIKKFIAQKKFLEKVFTQEEIKYCLNKRKPEGNFAGKFAAKEAVIKIIRNELKGVSKKEIEIINDPSGQPKVNLLKKNANMNIALSISHTKDYAVAVAISYED